MYSRIWFLVGILITYCEASSEAHYECGPHGRFEYCIDGIPGCVVGCHCHPGYYFDTESKICEPNSKLTHDYRRHYMAEPTRVPIINYDPASISTPTPTPANPIDAKVDAIAQDTDDIGDWLYNQFFKTIENQVINKTDNEPLTRRSGQPARPVPKRRSRKKTKKRSRRKKIGKRFRKKGLRRKLLRITEDDSLFDSGSKEYSSSSSSSSESDSESTSDSKEHGHRKIVMINKKSTSPLPSFIFLPNIETPFYPPVALAPPPVIPMYPMVPVPPMVPYPPPDCNNDNKTKSTPEHQNTTTTEATTTTSTSTTEEPATPTTTEAPKNDTTLSLRARGHRNLALRKHGQLNQLMRLRNKFKKNNKKHYMAQFLDDYQDPETPYYEDPNPPRPAPSMHPNPDMLDMSTPLENVDFKYLSQLIHKMDPNKSKPNNPFKPNRSMPNLELPISPELPMRRNYQVPSQSIQMQNRMSPDMQNAMLPKNNQMQAYLPTESYQMQNIMPTENDQVKDLVRPQSHQMNSIQPSQNMARPASKAEEYNNSFYSDLGKEIASLIRKVDGDRDINIQIEHLNTPMETMFNENSNSPHSYWERFARSPLRRKPFVENTKSLKRSSEVLNHLEDQVSLAKAIERTLSLHELENIANIMNRAQSKPPKIIKLKLKTPVKYPPTMEMSKRNNFNLWPLLEKDSDSKTQIQKYNNNVKHVDFQTNIQITVPNKKNYIKYEDHNLKPNNANQMPIIMRRTFDTKERLLDTKPYNINPVHQNNNIQKTPHRNVFATQPTKTDYYNNNYDKKISDLQNNVARNILEIQSENPKHVVLAARMYGDFNATKLNRNVSTNTINEEFLKKLLQSPMTPLHHQVSRIVRGNMTVPAEQIQRYQPSNPLLLNYKSFKFVTNTHNQYRPQHTLVPLPTVIRQIYKPIHTGTNAKTSYFHHEFHHLDYFK